MIPFRLYLISDEKKYPGILLKTLSQIKSLNPIGLQIREKLLTPIEQYSFTCKIINSLYSDKNCYHYINDRADIAISTGCYGVHLRGNSCKINQLHPLLRQCLSFGISTHSVEEVFLAGASGASFVTLGPIYETPSKIKFGKPLGADVLKEASRVSNIPIIALGGITLEKIEECIFAGAYGVGAISSIWSAKDPVKAIHDFQKALILAHIKKKP